MSAAAAIETGTRFAPRYPRTGRGSRARIPATVVAATLAAGLLAPASMAERIPPQEPVVYVCLSESATRTRISSAGGWLVGRWGTHRPPTRAPRGEPWLLEADGHRIRVRDGLGRARGAISETLFIYPANPREPLSLDGARYRGELILAPLGNGRMRITNALGLEAYLKGVLPAEIGRLGADEFEALKAQAVASRSYTLYQMNERRSAPFDLLPTEADQVYLGMDGEDARASAAVDATLGIVALYDGRIIRANYSSTCGGRTASAGAVWPERGGDLPYLRARRDRLDGRDFCSHAPHYRWEEVWECTEFLGIVRRNLWRAVPELRGGDPGAVTEMKILDRTPSGRAARLGIWTESGRYIIRGDQVRWVLRRAGGQALRSALLGRLRRERRGGRCVFVLEGGGFGHGVGMCQTGAVGMARRGYNYAQILKHYYRGIQLAQIYDGRRGRKSDPASGRRAP